MLAADCLDFDNPRRPRFVYVISDGGWYDTEDSIARIREYRETGVSVVHISIGCEPLVSEADRVVVITDPADAMTEIAKDTVEALQQHTQRPKAIRRRAKAIL